MAAVGADGLKEFACGIRVVWLQFIIIAIINSAAEPMLWLDRRAMKDAAALAVGMR